MLHKTLLENIVVPIVSEGVLRNYEQENGYILFQFPYLSNNLLSYFSLATTNIIQEENISPMPRAVQIAVLS
jgi:hypothetical protein